MWLSFSDLCVQFTEGRIVSLLVELNQALIEAEKKKWFTIPVTSSRCQCKAMIDGSLVMEMLILR